mgnify:CR=1 FL=1
MQRQAILHLPGVRRDAPSMLRNSLSCGWVRLGSAGLGPQGVYVMYAGVHECTACVYAYRVLRQAAMCIP